MLPGQASAVASVGTSRSVATVGTVAHLAPSTVCAGGRVRSTSGAQPSALTILHRFHLGNINARRRTSALAYSTSEIRPVEVSAVATRLRFSAGFGDTLVVRRAMPLVGDLPSSFGARVPRAVFASRPSICDGSFPLLRGEDASPSPARSSWPALLPRAVSALEYCGCVTFRRPERRLLTR